MFKFNLQNFILIKVIMTNFYIEQKKKYEDEENSLMYNIFEDYSHCLTFRQ